MEQKMVKVTNRDSGSTGYSIPDRNIWRQFAPGETKTIPFSELQALQYVPGGEFTLKHLLVINDKDALSALNIETEPEYFYTESEIKELLTKGSLDQLKDCLDFAPEGVIEINKKMAVDIKLPDTEKREAIYQATGFNVNNAIMVNTIMDENTEEKESAEKTRRVAPVNAEEGKFRRTAPSYNVVSTK